MTKGGELNSGLCVTIKDASRMLPGAWRDEWLGVEHLACCAVLRAPGVEWHFCGTSASLLQAFCEAAARLQLFAGRRAARVPGVAIPSCSRDKAPFNG